MTNSTATAKDSTMPVSCDCHVSGLHGVGPVGLPGSKPGKPKCVRCGKARKLVAISSWDGTENDICHGCAMGLHNGGNGSLGVYR